MRRATEKSMCKRAERSELAFLPPELFEAIENQPSVWSVNAEGSRPSPDTGSSDEDINDRIVGGYE